MSTGAVSASAADPAGSVKQPVRQAEKLSTLEVVNALINTDPGKMDVKMLGGCPFAWSHNQEKLFIADPPTTKELMKQEWQLGSVSDWPKSLTQLLGETSLIITHDAQLYSRLREVIGAMYKDHEMERMLPGIQAITQKHMSKWAAQGTVTGYTEMLTLVFDVLINEVLELGWSDVDVQKYARVFETWNQGFVAIINPLPWSKFSKGMRARQELVDRFRVSLRDPALKPNSIPAKLRDAFGVDSDITTNNMFVPLFGGFATTCGLATGLLWHLSRSPAALEKVRQEQADVAAAQGGKLTLASLDSMKYTQAAVNEVLRLRWMVSASPRRASKALDLPRAPPVPVGCPVKICWKGMSLQDPAVKGEETVFRPERWLDPANAATLADYQHPFGYGQHDCVGKRVARAIACAVAQELALKYSLAADAQDDFIEFPIGGRPRNGMPLTLKPL